MCDDAKMKAGVGMRWPQAREHLEPPEAGGDREDPPFEPLEGAYPCGTSTSDSWPPDCEGAHLRVVRPPAAPGHQPRCCDGGLGPPEADTGMGGPRGRFTRAPVGE